MINAEIIITGNADMISRLKRLNIGLSDFIQPMQHIGKSLTEYYSGQVFASQGGAIGLKWPTLAASTVAYKLKHYPQYATTPLIRTGDMQKSFKYLVDKDSVTISNDSPYFKYHQSSATRHKIPYRPMMSINNSVKTIIRQILKDDIDNKLRSI